jgi:hypothetical protein
MTENKQVNFLFAQVDSSFSLPLRLRRLVTKVSFMRRTAGAVRTHRTKVQFSTAEVGDTDGRVTVSVDCVPMYNSASFRRIHGSGGGLTVKIDEARMAPVLAVIVVVPGCNNTASPRLPSSLLIDATVGSEELQVADSRVLVMLSLNVPVATNCWTPAVRETAAVDGVTDMEINPFGGIRVWGIYRSAVAKYAPL